MLVVAMLAALAVDVVMSPLPPAASPVPKLTIWSVYACSDAPARVAGVRIEAAAAAHVRILPRSIALEMIQRRTADTRASRALRIGGAALALSTAVSAGGLVAATPRLVSALALATTAAPEIGGRLRALIPVFDSSQLLGPEVLEIPAGGCLTALALSPRARSIRSVSFVVPAVQSAASPARWGGLGFTPTTPARRAELSSIPVRFVRFE